MGSGAATHRNHRSDEVKTQEALECFDRVEHVGPESSLSEHSWRAPKKPWIYTRVKAYNAEEWQVRFGTGACPILTMMLSGGDNVR